MGANLLLNKTLGPFDHLVGSCRTLLLARDAWRRLSDLLPTTTDQAAVVVSGAEPGLVVRDASVHTADGKVLLGTIDCHILPGTFAVVSGRNGSGKTTLLRMLAGVSPPASGSVLLDGNPVRGGPEIGYLPQSVSLLDGTIATNIGRLQDDLAGVIAASRQAAVHDQIGRMSGGYEAMLSGNGATLSGGMRQRVGLARALFGAPRLLLLDEPDASLDSAGIDALLLAIRECCEAGAIAVVISHRPALLQAADLVITMSQGGVADLRTAVRAAPSKLEIA